MSKSDVYTRKRVLYTSYRNFDIGVDFDAGHYVYTRRQMYEQMRPVYTYKRVLYTGKRDLKIGVDFDAGHDVDNSRHHSDEPEDDDVDDEGCVVSRELRWQVTKESCPI